MIGRRAILAAAAAALAAAGAWALGRGQPCPKPDDAFALYAVGDSTPADFAHGGRLALADLAAQALGGRIAGRPISARTLARPGQTLFPQTRELERALRCRAGGPGAVLIYGGHNDRPSRRIPTLLEQLEHKVFFRWRPAREIALWARRRGLLRGSSSEISYELHLRRLIRLSLDAGLTPVVGLPVSNLAGMDPGSGEDRRAPSAEERRRLLEPGVALERAGRCAQALTAYREAASRSPAVGPYADFLSARCAHRLGRHLEARRLLWRAVDDNRFDSFGRATTWQLEAARRAAGELGARLVDAPALFLRAAPDGLPGDELFLDGQHPNAAGAALLADAYAAEIASAFGAPAPRRHAGRLTDASLPKAVRVEARLRAARWLFNVSIGHFRPEHRLGMAERRWKEAATLDPDDFSARFGLCLVEAARRSDLVARQENAAWLARYPSPWSPRFEIPDSDWDGVRRRLAALGVPPALLDRATAARRLSGARRTL